MLCWFLLYNNANKPLLYIYLLPLEPPSPLPIPPLQVIKEHQTRLPVLYSNFSPAIYFTHDNVYMSMLLSPFVPVSPSPAVFTTLFFIYESPFCPCK